MGGKVSSYLWPILTVSEGIKRDLMSGTTIVVDRYIYSGVAFTAAKVVDLRDVADVRDLIIHGVEIPIPACRGQMQLYFYRCRVVRQLSAEDSERSDMRRRRCSKELEKCLNNYKRIHEIRLTGIRLTRVVMLNRLPVEYGILWSQY